MLPGHPVLWKNGLFIAHQLKYSSLFQFFLLPIYVIVVDNLNIGHYRKECIYMGFGSHGLCLCFVHTNISYTVFFSLASHIYLFFELYYQDLFYKIPISTPVGVVPVLGFPENWEDYIPVSDFTVLR